MIFFFWGDILRVTTMEGDNLNLGPSYKGEQSTPLNYEALNYAMFHYIYKNVAVFLVET